MTDLSARFALPMLQPGQAQKEMFHNEALARIDAALHPAAPEIATDAVPSAPTPGQSWIVGLAQSGAWEGKAGQIAFWTGGGWRFVTPVTGMTVWIASMGHWAWHNGTGWQSGPLPTNGIHVAGVQVVGAQRGAISNPIGGSAIDAEGRAAIASILETLRDHGLIAT